MLTILAGSGLLPDPPHIAQTPVDEVTNTIFLIGVLAAIAFTLLYSLKSRWYQTHAGRSVWAVFVSFTLLLIDLFASRWIGHDYAGRDWLRLIPYTLLTVSLVYMLATLLASLQSTTQILGSELKAHTGPVPVQDDSEEQV